MDVTILSRWGGVGECLDDDDEGRGAGERWGSGAMNLETVLRTSVVADVEEELQLHVREHAHR